MKPAPFFRLNEGPVLRDLKTKIVLLSGPRQVGKTWLAKKIMGRYKTPLYLNYDSFADKKIIEKQLWPDFSDLIVFDEIHKMKDWKNYIKGVFDTRPRHRQILVTGSARLQQMNRSGDSLAGRCFSHTLFPFSPFELSQINKLNFNRFFDRGGFPEPLLIAKNKVSAERWREQYMFSLLREDIPDFRPLQNYGKMKTLLFLLEEAVGSPVSISSLSRSLKIDHKTVLRYLSILKELFIVFSVPAFSKSITRSLSKAEKFYFYDFGFIDPARKGARLENLTALCLMKHCSYLRETSPARASALAYLRTKEQREVDFLLTKKNRPALMLEVKMRDVAFSKNLIYFHDRYGIAGKQLSLNLKQAKQIRGKQIISENLETFLLSLKT